MDRAGVWLSARSIRRHVRRFEGQRVGDFGCGYQASFARTIAGTTESLILADVSLAPDLADLPGVTIIEGALPGCLGDLPDHSLDVALAISVLEHLDDPSGMLMEMRRLVAPGGTCIVNVPTWRGKVLLEFSAFRLGLSPAAEMDDHRCYYDPRDLWPLLVRAGFRPQEIQCRRHKFGLNTIAVCRTPGG